MTDSPARQLDALIGRFDPALAIAFASTERRGDWIVSLAVHARGVKSTIC